jgi:hypothetical protein
MEITTAITIIISVLGASGMIITAVLNYAKSFKNEKVWERPVEDVRRELESHKINMAKQISEIENKLSLLSLDAVKIEEIKSWILRIEESIDEESKHLGDKIDELMRLVIELLQGKKK